VAITAVDYSFNSEERRHIADRFVDRRPATTPVNSVL
jgi:hypothetical protein